MKKLVEKLRDWCNEPFSQPKSERLIENKGEIGFQIPISVGVILLAVAAIISVLMACDKCTCGICSGACANCTICGTSCCDNCVECAADNPCFNACYCGGIF